MKIFKSADVVIQLITIVLGILVGLLNPNYVHYPYFIVGGWQLFSCIIHGTVGGYFPYSSRGKYLKALGIVILLGIICFINGLLINPSILILYLGLLMIVSPFLAFWYCFICYKEVKLYQQKEWIQLK